MKLKDTIIVLVLVVTLLTIAVMGNMSKRNNIFKIIKGIVISIFFMACIYFYFKRKNEKSTLKKDGKTTIGVIIKTSKNKRGLDFQYKYNVSGVEYTNWGTTYSESILLNDTINILYDPNHPKTSRANFELK